MDGITALDYILLPFYLLVIYKIAYRYRDKHYPLDHPFRPYFIPGLTVKIAGAIFIGLIYDYYYGGGDTFNYFYHSQIINSTFTETPGTWLRLITHNANQSVYADAEAMGNMYWYDDKAAYTTSCLGAFIGIFCFTKYLIINTITACISFVGMWCIFKTFATQYPAIVKYIAVAVLFMPGSAVWGSGLFKDSFCMFSIGVLVYCTHTLFEKKHFKVYLVILSLLSIILIVLIKAYILAVLLPVLILKSLLFYKKSIASRPLRKIFFYIALISLIVVTIKVSSSVINYFTTISVDEVLQTVKTQKDYLLRTSIAQEGAAYDLGDFEPSITGILKMAVPAINVTLFRPYLWESRSIIQLLNALESAAIFLLTIYLLLKRSLLSLIKQIYNDPNLVACLIFSLLFAFVVGVSSYNFGSLSRYKIPCTPFYMLFLMILIFKTDQPSKNPDSTNIIGSK